MILPLDPLSPKFLEAYDTVVKLTLQKYARRQSTLGALVPVVPRWPMLPKKLGPPRVTNTSPASYRARPPR